MTKWLIAIALVLVIAAGAYYWLKMVKVPAQNGNSVTVTTVTKVGNPKGTPPATNTP
jgi:hypothetical protein